MSTPGYVNRTNLQSFYQNAGETYDDNKTEGAFGVLADQNDANWDYISSLVNNGTLSPYPAFLSRQAIINGNFDRWERATNPTSPSFTNPASNAYIADRWKAGSLNADGGTLPTNIIHSRQLLTPGDISNANFYYRVNPDGAGSSFGANSEYTIRHLIENGTRYLCGANRKVTISFWARSSIANKRLGVCFVQTYGTGGSPSANEVMNGSSFTLTSAWQRFTLTLTTNTLAGKTFGSNNDDNLFLEFGIIWGSARFTRYGVATVESFGGAGNIDIAQVQVNTGDQALPFQPRSIGEELALCQRYCKSFTDEINANCVVGFGSAATTTIALINVNLPRTMRIQPTLIANAADFVLNDGISTIPCTALSVQSNQNGRDTLTIRATVASGLTAFRPYTLCAAAATKLLILDAEL